MKYLWRLHDNTPVHEARIVIKHMFLEKVIESHTYTTHPVFAICSPTHVRYVKFHLSEKDTHYKKNQNADEGSYQKCFQEWIGRQKKSEVRPPIVNTLKDRDVINKCELKQLRVINVRNILEIYLSQFPSPIAWKF